MTSPWSLRIGTAGRLRGLPAVLGSLQGAGGEVLDAPVVSALGDLGELASAARTERGRLVLDADALPLEDLGYLRRYLDGAARAGARRVVLIGDDPGLRAVRALLGRDEVRFVSWPPDLEQLGRLLTPPAPLALAGGDEVDVRAPSAPEALAGPRTDPPRGRTGSAPEPIEAAGPFDSGPAPGARATGRRPSMEELRAAADAGPLDEAELAVIGTILAAPPPRNALFEVDEDQDLDTDEDEDPEPSFDLRRDWAPQDDDDDGFEGQDDGEELEDLDDDDELEDLADEERAHEAARGRELAVTELLAPKAPPPPRYFREQVADLADIVQSIDLSLRVSEADTEPVAHDVARLVQFTRTLGYHVAPPPQGRQELDVGVLLEELVAQLVASRAGAPRCLLRPEGELRVRSDKQLLTQAFDALLFLAAACADEHDVVRVRARAERERGDRIAIEIEFPAGPLDGLDPERIVEPYSVRDRVPDLGPNALRAALGILSGQGGRAELVRLAPGRLAWRVELPPAPRAG